MSPHPRAGVRGCVCPGAFAGQKECFFAPQVVDSQLVVISLIMRRALRAM